PSPAPGPRTRARRPRSPRPHHRRRTWRGERPTAPRAARTSVVIDAGSARALLEWGFWGRASASRLRVGGRGDPVRSRPFPAQRALVAPARGPHRTSEHIRMVERALQGARVNLYTT